MDHTNEMQLIFDSRSSNESFARVTVAAFMTSGVHRQPACHRGDPHLQGYRP